MTFWNSRPLKQWIAPGGTVLAITLGLLVVPRPGWLTSSGNVNASVQQSFEIPESERRHIGVLDLKFHNLSHEEMEQTRAISERLRQNLRQLGLFKIVEHPRMKSIMEDVGFQYGKEDTTAGLTDVGEILGVTEMLGGSVSKVGSIYSIHIRLISVMTSGVIESAYCDVMDISELLDSGVQQVVQSLGSAVSPKMQTSLDESGHFTFTHDRDRVGVLRLESNNLPQGVADAVTERLSFFLGRTTFAHVLERESIESILEEIAFQATQTSSGDVDHAVAINRILTAEKVIAGSVSRVGDSYSLQIRVIHVESSKPEFNAFAEVDTVEEVLTSAVYSVVNQLEEHYRER
ncbi:hypothetical protein ACFL3H_09600 [Gemmatimonadota bacterium]